MKNSFESFYEDNKEFLTHNYPGLKVLRLIQEFEDCTTISQEKFKEKLLQGIPLEYISNLSHFYRDQFYVDDRVLIPRSETEILVEESIKFIKKNGVESVYEIGVGSGCISISIAQDCPKVSIVGSDISKKALAVANKNLEFRKLNIKFEEQDLISDGDYEFIVSNPPYIKYKMDKGGVHHQTDSFEPHIALYLKDEEFDEWFNRLFRLTSSYLKPGGAFFMEGHEDSLSDLKKIALNYYERIDIIKDYTQRDRFLFCYKDYSNG